MVFFCPCRVIRFKCFRDATRNGISAVIYGGMCGAVDRGSWREREAWFDNAEERDSRGIRGKGHSGTGQSIRE